MNCQKTKINNESAEEIDIAKDYKEIKRSGKEKKTNNKEEKLDFTLKSKNVSINENSFSSNIENLLIITFEKPEIVDFIMIGEKLMKPNFFEKNKLYINIPKGSFETGEYFLALFLKNRNVIATNHSISFTYDKNPVQIINITPKNVKNNIDRSIVLQGNGFSKVIGVQLSNGIVLKKAFFEVINDMVMFVNIPKGLEVGEYYLNSMDVNSIYELKDKKFSITK